ncbi:MAG: glycosyltransferase family 4 protein [Thermodesulfobacteriota bacterium]
MKLLIYTHEFPPFLGGLATTSHKLANGIGATDIDVVVLAPGYGPEDQSVDEKLPCKVIRAPMISKKWIKVIPFAEIAYGQRYLSNAIREEKPDAVLFITEEAEAAGGNLNRYDFSPIVRIAGSGITTCFYGNKFFKKVMRRPMKKLYDNASKIIAVSHNTKELVESVGVPSDKIEVVYNGVENYLLSSEPDQGQINSLRNSYGISSNDKVLLTVARVLPRKGQDMVIRSLPEVLKQFPNLKYLIVGDGRYRQKFSELAQELAVSENVIFTGGVAHEEVISFIDMCDIFVMPNRYWNNKIEGLPNALIEASARKKPLIAGNHGGSVEAVKDGETGFLVDPESPEDLASAINKILGDEKLAIGMGAAGKENVLKNHTEDGMIKNYIDVIRRSL